MQRTTVRRYEVKKFPRQKGSFRFVVRKLRDVVLNAKSSRRFVNLPNLFSVNSVKGTYHECLLMLDISLRKNYLIDRFQLERTIIELQMI